VNVALLPWRRRPFSAFTLLLLFFVVLLTGAWVALGALAALPSLAATEQPAAITLQLTPFATGLSQPVDIATLLSNRAGRFALSRPMAQCYQPPSWILIAV
jgi:hypothetical protein